MASMRPFRLVESWCPMRLSCPDCQLECTVDERSVDTVTCPGCGLLLYSKSGGSAVVIAKEAAKVEFSEVELEKTRQWQKSVDDILPVPDLFPQKLGRYELRQKLGEGSFAEVYLAFDSELGREVALKIPRRSRFASAEQLRRFLDEARTAAILEHPGIVRVYDIGWISEEICYISMEHCTGSSLSDRIKSGPFTHDQAAELVESLAEAIHFAHLHGFVHRDLKPSNVMFGRDGRPRIVDFGLALSDEEQLKRVGEIAGTLPYMSPEQIRGDTHHLDGRTDIWSLGVILYQLLVGRRPFTGSRELIVDQIRNREAKPLRQIKDDIPAELETICLRCLQKSPADRYSTAKDFAQDLRVFRERRTSLASRTTPDAPPQPRRSSISRWIYIALAMLILLGCLGGLWAVVLPARRLDVTTNINWSVDDKPLGMAFDLLQREPRKLGWPSQEIPTFNFTHDPKTLSLTINSPGFTLLELGETEATEFRLEGDIYHTAPAGVAGFFWGFGWQNENDPKNKSGALQAAFVRARTPQSKAPTQFLLQHIRVWPHRELGLVAQVYDSEGGQSVQFVGAKMHRLTIHVGANRLVDLAWDHQRMNEILEQHDSERKAGLYSPSPGGRPPFRVKGRFGILTQGAGVTARNVRFTPINRKTTL